MSGAHGVKHVCLRFVQLVQHLFYLAFSKCLGCFAVCFLNCEPVFVNMFVSLQDVLKNEMQARGRLRLLLCGWLDVFSLDEQSLLFNHLLSLFVEECSHL